MCEVFSKSNKRLSSLLHLLWYHQHDYPLIYRSVIHTAFSLHSYWFFPSCLLQSDAKHIHKPFYSAYIIILVPDSVIFKLEKYDPFRVYCCLIRNLSWTLTSVKPSKSRPNSQPSSEIRDSTCPRSTANYYRSHMILIVRPAIIHPCHRGS